MMHIWSAQVEHINRAEHVKAHATRAEALVDGKQQARRVDAAVAAFASLVHRMLAELPGMEAYERERAATKDANAAAAAAAASVEATESLPSSAPHSAATTGLAPLPSALPSPQAESEAEAAPGNDALAQSQAGAATAAPAGSEPQAALAPAGLEAAAGAAAATTLASAAPAPAIVPTPIRKRPNRTSAVELLAKHGWFQWKKEVRNLAAAAEAEFRRYYSSYVAWRGKVTAQMKVFTSVPMPSIV
jgi:hypothetical protein